VLLGESPKSPATGRDHQRVPQRAFAEELLGGIAVRLLFEAIDTTYPSRPRAVGPATHDPTEVGRRRFRRGAQEDDSLRRGSGRKHRATNGLLEDIFPFEVVIARKDNDPGVCVARQHVSEGQQHAGAGPPVLGLVYNLDPCVASDLTGGHFGVIFCDDDHGPIAGYDRSDPIECLLQERLVAAQRGELLRHCACVNRVSEPRQPRSLSRGENDRKLLCVSPWLDHFEPPFRMRKRHSPHCTQGARARRRAFHNGAVTKTRARLPAGTLLPIEMNDNVINPKGSL
jgi:hypothetical protein